MVAKPMMEQAAPAIVLIGHIVKEMIYFPDRELGPVLGSPVAYGSVVAARLGERVGIVTTIGTDMPDELLQPFREAGVDTQGILIKSGSETTASELIYYESGNKEIRYPQKAPPIQFKDIPTTYHQAHIFYIATMDHDVPLETIGQLQSLEAKLAIDLGGYGGAHSRQHPDEAEQKVPTRLRELISHFDIVRASVEDCTHLLGADRVATETGEEEVVQLFLSWGAEVGLLTLGERGCIVGDQRQIVRIPAQQGQVIDTTGAGDSFSTAFLVGYMHTGDIAWSAQFAAATVIQIIERTGGVRASRMPTRAEVNKLLSI
jgi:sugar/nucleoside kinase (ribokinase family)